MRTMAVRRSSVLLTVGALTASALLVGPAEAESPSPAPPAPVRTSAPAMAAGVIVTTTGSAPTAATLRKADSLLGGDNDVAKVLKRGAKTAVLVTSERLPVAVAEVLADDLELRPDVVSASPNYIRRAYGDAPVVTNDPNFNVLKHIWDPRSRTDSRVKAILGSSNTFPNGGYSSKAPAAWASTRGADQVVAVIDSGITRHPDLDDQVLPGYDFITNVGYDWGRDGDGRDSDPSDMGDWEDADESCDGSGDAYDSSWHGTHVAGIVAAEADNAQGVVGVAPSVKVVPVRVLGLCGATDQDIADGIRWAAGLSVPGVPDNPNPADVINLSLGGFGRCTDAPTLSSAIAAAQSSGVVVVAAAGNDAADIVKYPTTPATCAGVISVGATSEYGDRAGYRVGSSKMIYSNHGSTLDISAPGGDSYWDGRGIWSTINTGTKSPAAPGLARYEGTSMAAPVVAAGAALIRSTGSFTPLQTEAALEAAVAPFPSGTAAAFKRCTTSICGKGILDLSRIVAPTSGASITGSLAVNERLTAVPGAWVVRPSAFRYQWLRDGAPISGATSSTYLVTAADVGRSISVRISPSTGAFAPATVTAHTDPSDTVVPDGPVVSMTGLPASTKYGTEATVTVKVGTEAAPVDGPVELRRGSDVVATGTAVNGMATIVVPRTSWLIGANAIRAAYTGANPASSPTTSVTIAKASASVTFSMPTKISNRSRARVTATVTATGGVETAGYLYVYSGSKRILKVSLPASANGVRTFSLPALSERAHFVKVKFGGSATVLAKSSSVKKLRVY